LLLVIILVLFISTINPLLISILLIVTSIIITVYIFNIINFSWFMLIMILTFTGGMIIMFLYISSLVPNEIVNVDVRLVNINIVFILFVILLINKSGERKLFNSLRIYVSFKLIILSLTLLLYTMMVMVKMSYNPDIPLKSLM